MYHARAFLPHRSRTVPNPEKESAMRLEQLSHLIEITRLQSISKAAETLHISQPALSASVKSLETELGVALFKRTNRGIFLTSEGEKIHDDAVGILNVINGWYTQYHDQEPEGEIHLACTPIISCYITPNIIVPFQKRYPKITIFVHSAQHYDIIGKLTSTSADIALTTLSGNARLIEQIRDMNWDEQHLFTDERRLFIGSSHPLAAKKELTREDLKSLNLAYYSDVRDQISRFYVPFFGTTFRLANKEDILDLVIKNEAVFIQPCHLFRHDYRVMEKLLVEKRIPLTEVDSRADVFALHAPELSPIEQLFWDYLIENFSCNL